MKKLYDEMRKAIRVKNTHFIASDGWVDTSANFSVEIEEYPALSFRKQAKSTLILEYSAQVITDDDSNLPEKRDKLAKHIYHNLYGEIINRLSELNWHISNSDRENASKLCRELLNNIDIERSTGE